MELSISVDLRPQHTPRGAALQDADCARIGGVAHYVAGCRRRSKAARHLYESARRLKEATERYADAGLSMEWYVAGRWEYQAAKAASGLSTGAHPDGSDW